MLLPDQFQQWVRGLGLQLSPACLQGFEEYRERLVKVNESMNLTRITSPEDIYTKHFYDALTLSKVYDFTQPAAALLDIGSGAGFPAFPLKLVFPALRVAVVDARGKRILFLQELAQALRLDKISYHHARAEVLGHQPSLREAFPLVVARAVAPLPVLLEYSLPFVQTGGLFVAMKGDAYQQELQASQPALELLGGQLVREERFALPLERGNRALLCFTKQTPTPSIYPRREGVPTRSPL